ncbi:MAG TPA: PorV/PorQ family protein [Bacteroides sp.]|nr:PorV/PorQ family protein [Bacteroides sp.]
MIRKYLILLIAFFLPAVLLAQLPKYSNEFLNIGVGARAFGMSHSVLATTTDVTAGYWNPAGLTGLETDADIGLMHAEYFAGIAKYDYAGFAIRIDEQSAGAFTLIRFGIDDIPNTLELIDKDGNLRYDRISTFSAADYGFLFSYARTSKIVGLSYGGNVKLIHRKIGDFATAWGFGFDIAGRYVLNRWSFAVNIRDVTSTFNAWNFNTSELEDVFAITGNEIPQNSLELTMPRILMGAARSFRLHEDFNLLAELDADLTLDGKQNVLVKTAVFSIDPHMGLELDYKRLVFLRLGMGKIKMVPDYDQKDSFNSQPNLGIGIHFRNFTVDYALTDIANQSIAPYSNIFSLKYSFNRPGSSD